MSVAGVSQPICSWITLKSSHPLYGTKWNLTGESTKEGQDLDPVKPIGKDFNRLFLAKLISIY